MGIRDRSQCICAMFQTGLYPTITAGIRTQLPLIQLIGLGRVSDLLTTAAGLNLIASYANGIDPALSRIVSEMGPEKQAGSQTWWFRRTPEDLSCIPIHFARMSCPSTILMNSFVYSFLTSGLTEDLQISTI